MTGLNVKRIAQPMPWPRELAIDWQIVNPATVPAYATPIERALGILAPHLRREPLYRDR